VSVEPFAVWSGARHGGIFPTIDQAIAHCRVIANDHRPRPELDELAAGVWRYVGPRGRRHGPRFVAFVLSRLAIEDLNADVIKLLRFLPKG
jgi:hypothetical protein